MTLLFEMPIQLGGDPGDFSECAALRAELAKMNHPACPEVNWAQIERLCLALFRKNGAELQTAACYVLACGHRDGFAGLARSMTLVESLIGRWSGVWPPQHEARVAILDWLFRHLAPLIRRRQIDGTDVQALADLHLGLHQLNRQLIARVGTSQIALDGLCRQVARINARVEPEHQLFVSNVLLAGAQSAARRLPELMPALPVLPNIERKKPRFKGWAPSAGALLVMSITWLCVWYWLADSKKAVVLPAPVQLSSLALFDAGSAELRPGSTRVLVEALVNIKAQPGWLIVISGHTDGTGDAGKNLQLSRDRALAVKTWMQSMGDFPDSCFAVQGLGAGSLSPRIWTNPGARRTGGWKSG